MSCMAGNLPVCLYGLDPDYRMVRYWNVRERHPRIGDLRSIAKTMQEDFPDILKVFAVDVSKDVYDACRDARRTNLLEDRVVFKVLLETEGIQLI
jgi:hypothetical protein